MYGDRGKDKLSKSLSKEHPGKGKMDILCAILPLCNFEVISKERFKKDKNELANKNFLTVK